jgi:futalosine hydrolase
MIRLNRAFFVPTLKEAEKIFPGVSFYKNSYGLHFCDLKDGMIVVTGIGKSNATFAASVIFAEYSFEIVYFIGICGAYKSSCLKIGDLISVEYDYFADEGLLDESGNYRLISEMGFPVVDNGKDFIIFDRAEGITGVSANTVSFLSGTDYIADIYSIKTGAHIENMEGAAFGLVCEKFGQRAVHIRSVSNYCGNRDEQNWNIMKAFDSLYDYVKSHHT